MSKRLVLALVVGVGAVGVLLVGAAVGARLWRSGEGSEPAAPAPVAPPAAPAAESPALTPYVVFSLERAPDGETADPIRFEPPVLQPADAALVGARTVSLPRSGWECRVYRRAETPETATIGCLHTPERFAPGGPQASASNGWRCERETVTPPLVLSSMERAGWVDWYVRVECRGPDGAP